MSNRSSILAAAALVACLAPVSGRAQGEADMVRFLEERALARDPELRALRAEQEELAGMLQQAGRRPNPRVGLEVEDVGGDGASSASEAEWTLVWSQALEPRRARTHRRRVQRAALAAKEREVASRIRRVRTTVAMAHARCRCREGQVRLADESLAVAAQVARTVERRVSAGAASSLETKKAEVDLASARSRVARARKEREAALAQLAHLVGTAPNALPPLGLCPPVLAPLPPLADLLARLEQGHPDVEARRHALEAARAEVDLLRTERRGEREVEAGVRRLGDEGTTFVVGLQVPLTIRDRKRGAIRAASQRARAAEARIDGALFDLAAEVKAIHGELEAITAEVVVVQRELVPAARAAFDLASEGYARGKFPFLHVLDAEASLLGAQERIIEAKITYCTRLAELEALTGLHAPVDERSAGPGLRPTDHPVTPTKEDRR